MYVKYCFQCLFLKKNYKIRLNMIQYVRIQLMFCLHLQYFFLDVKHSNLITWVKYIMSMKSNRECDIDVVVHLGNIRNIDMSVRGIYFFRVSLYWGAKWQAASPIGFFSAPSRLESFVRDRVVSKSNFLTVIFIIFSTQDTCWAVLRCLFN